MDSGRPADSPGNLVALPADAATRAKRAAKDGFILPIHSSSHPNYDKIAYGVTVMVEAEYGDAAPTPARARAILEEAARRMTRLIKAGTWMPKLR